MGIFMVLGVNWARLRSALFSLPKESCFCQIETTNRRQSPFLVALQEQTVSEHLIGCWCRFQPCLEHQLPIVRLPNYLRSRPLHGENVFCLHLLLSTLCLFFLLVLRALFSPYLIQWLLADSFSKLYVCSALCSVLSSSKSLKPCWFAGLSVHSVTTQPSASVIRCPAEFASAKANQPRRLVCRHFCRHGMWEKD